MSLAVGHISRAMFGVEPHLPLGMVKAGVTAVTCLRLPRLLYGEGVSGVTVLAVHTVLVILSVLHSVSHLIVVNAQVMATVAPFLSCYEGLWLLVGKLRKRHHRQKTQEVLARHVLLHLLAMAPLTGLDGRKLRLMSIFSTGMCRAMTGLTGKELGHLTSVEVLNYTWSDFLMATLTGRRPCQHLV